MKHLTKQGWKIDSHCLGRTRGVDICASKGSQQLIIEAKGAKSGLDNPTRLKFDSGQIKTHFGKALTKALTEKYKNPNAIVAIAHPFDDDIKKAISHLIYYLSQLNIKHFWVHENGSVTET